MTDKPLSGVRVLDLTRVLSGPFMTMLLCDMGAEVIKLETLSGDDARYFAPFNESGESLYFAAVNRGKKSITLNLKAAEGKELFLNLIKSGKIDVIAENYRGGTMEKLGIGWEELHKLNPRLIYVAISGFGHTGDDYKQPAYDIIAQARSGLMSITGIDGLPPARVGTSTGDLSAGVFAAFGVAAALYKREKTGEGQKIDISMLDCQIAMLENALTRYQSEGKNPTALGNAHPTLVPFQAFKAKDSYFVLAAANDSLWIKVCAALDKPKLAEDEKFKTGKARLDNKEELIGLLSAVFAEKNTDYWLSLFNSVGVPCCNIAKISDLFNDKQIAARNMLLPLADTDIKVAGNPVKMSGLPEDDRLPSAPSLGADNQNVLGGLLGMTSAEINELHTKGVL